MTPKTLNPFIIAWLNQHDTHTRYSLGILNACYVCIETDFDEQVRPAFTESTDTCVYFETQLLMMGLFAEYGRALRKRLGIIGNDLTDAVAAEMATATALQRCGAFVDVVNVEAKKELSC